MRHALCWFSHHVWWTRWRIAFSPHLSFSIWPLNSLSDLVSANRRDGDGERSCPCTLWADPPALQLSPVYLNHSILHCQHSFVSQRTSSDSYFCQDSPRILLTNTRIYAITIVMKGGGRWWKWEVLHLKQDSNPPLLLFTALSQGSFYASVFSLAFR